VSRLSVRIFVAFFVTLLMVGASVVGITSWVLSESHRAASETLSENAIEASAALERDGVDGLTEWATQLERSVNAARDGGTHVLVLDEWGDDLLRRPVPAEIARKFEGAQPGAAIDDRVRGLPTLLSPDGERFYLHAVGDASVGPFGLPSTRMPLAIVALLITALVSSVLAHSITRPVRALQRTTRELAAGNLDARVAPEAVERRDELGKLAQSFDTMAARLAELLRARERLLRDVSHEIRSPLTRMRLATELARDGVGLDLQLERIDTEVERLDMLVGNILDVARLEAGSEILRRDPLDLVALVDRICTDAGFEAQAKGCSVEWHAPETDFQILGDADWTGAAIENVVRNALHHAPRDSSVEVQLVADADRYRLFVRDTGPGVPAHELERIFEPFHRVAPDRARESGGAGLGLAITARVMNAQGGGCRARNLARGLEISLWWPPA